MDKPALCEIKSNLLNKSHEHMPFATKPTGYASGPYRNIKVVLLQNGGKSDLWSQHHLDPLVLTTTVTLKFVTFLSSNHLCRN
ncbi:hypothetical protein TNCV_4040571 [Trichonephila clavipes]|nr:hypothetical protein TNCV_4040571 [Trichonephila clavipes]